MMTVLQESFKDMNFEKEYDSVKDFGDITFICSGILGHFILKHLPDK